MLSFIVYCADVLTRTDLWWEHRVLEIVILIMNRLHQSHHAQNPACGIFAQQNYEWLDKKDQGRIMLDWGFINRSPDENLLKSSSLIVGCFLSRPMLTLRFMKSNLSVKLFDYHCDCNVCSICSIIPYQSCWDLMPLHHAAWEPEIRSLARPYKVLLLCECICRWFIFRFWDGQVELQEWLSWHWKCIQSGSQVRCKCSTSVLFLDWTRL